MLALASLLLVLGAAPGPLRLDPPAPRLGDLALIYVRDDAPLERGVLRTIGLEFPLFRSSPQELRAVVAIPMDIDPGEREVEIVLGDRVLKAVLSIKDRTFDSSELVVGREFTRPKSKALRAQLRAEARSLDAIFVPEVEPLRFAGAIQRPVSGQITGVFGTRRIFNGRARSVHYGLDLDARVGTPVRAVQGGVVVLSAMRWASGGTIIVDHGAGLFTAYYHLSKRRRVVGERVKAGALLGSAGRTGRVTGPHLHLAVMVRARVYDPAVGLGPTRWFYVDPESLLARDFSPFVQVGPVRRESGLPAPP